MSAPELKPCPFCGGKKLYAGYNEFGGLVTLCANCEAHGPSSEADKEQILAAWNTRAEALDVKLKEAAQTAAYASNEIQDYIDDDGGIGPLEDARDTLRAFLSSIGDKQ